MPRRYPPLKYAEVIAILVALGFTKDRHNKHAAWERKADEKMPRKVVPVDDYSQFDQTLLKRMIGQTGFSRDDFYNATPSTAAKIR